MNDPTPHDLALDQTASDTRTGAFLGRGRSAAVYAVGSSASPIAARKVFEGSTLAGLVHHFFFGADNPYIWSRETIAEAHHRREVLDVLVRWWLPGKLRVARSHGTGWNDEIKVNELTMDFVDGAGARLWNPLSNTSDRELDELVWLIMKPLQRNLIDAGFVGAAWQAGYFNPVATSNFLLDRKPDGTKEWVWIDMESGVPALFSANPYGLLSFYLPQSIKLRRPLFDDVDVEKLRHYLEIHGDTLKRDMGAESWDALNAASRKLEHPNNRWRALGWLHRGIEARLCRSEITPDEADWYRARPGRWIAREARRAIRKSADWLGDKLFSRLKLLSLVRFVAELARLIISESKRAAFARRFIGQAIDKWTARKQLDATEHAQLMDDLQISEAGVYLADFGMHLVIKPVVKLVVWLIIPILYGVGLVNETVVIVAAAAGGAIGRTGYTSYRILHSAAHHRPRPWVALLVGMLPVVGNVAFPTQVLFDGTKGGDLVARFIICHLLTRLGQLLPIWGGLDTIAEHRFNRLACFLLARRSHQTG